MEAQNIWSETGREVARTRRRLVQLYAAQHPGLFYLAWGLKIAVWNGPKAAIRLVAGLVKRRKAPAASAAVVPVRSPRALRGRS